MIGITLGDPAGIGIEIVLKALKRVKGKTVLIGSENALFTTAERLKLTIPRNAEIVSIAGRLRFRFGVIQKDCGIVAWAALEKGVALLKQGAITGLVTAPVAKEALWQAGFPFPGQTEFLAARLGAKKHAMLAYSEGVSAPRHKGTNHGGTLRIVFVTIHQPIAQVPKAITARLVAEKLNLLNDFLRRYEKLSLPRIAVLALNPHGYEFTLGEEEKIAQGIKLSDAKAQGPFPADSISILLREYDGIVAMYHDQAMIPAKLLSAGKGVNVTLGLPRIRTSPLHGTAFDIAGRGCASADSMTAAISACRRWAMLRRGNRV